MSPTQESPERNEKTGEYQSGQMGQTVNLLVYTFGGSNPSSPTNSGEVRRRNRPKETKNAEVKLRQCSSGVERFLGKEEVMSSNLITGSAFFVYNTH